MNFSYEDLRLLASKNVTTHFDGWLELNVTGAAQWTSKNNKGLFIRAYLVEKPDHEVRLDDIGLINSKGDDEYQAFMVAYFKAPEVGISFESIINLLINHCLFYTDDQALER